MSVGKATRPAGGERHLRRVLLLVALMAGPFGFLMFSLRAAGMPDFAAACQAGAPYYVAAAYRGQIDYSRPPNSQAPSVLLFQDTPENRVHHALATFKQVGAVWGLAYSRREQAVYAATYHKRGLPYGPAGSGGIYRIDLRTGAISTFATVPNAGGREAGLAMGNGTRDFDWYQARFVGKVALGDLDLSGDESELFVVNLRDRRIYRYETATGRLIGSFDHGAATQEWANDARPFALTWYAGQLYHGLVNESGAKPFVAEVYRSEADGSAMTLVASVDLRYRRDRVELPMDRARLFEIEVKWVAWSDRDPPPRAQPMLTDLVFTDDQTLTLAIRDRYWDINLGWVLERQNRCIRLPCDEVNVYLTTDQMGFGDLLVANKLPDGSFAVTTAPESLQDSNALGQQESALGGLACAADGPGLAAGIYGVKRVSAEAILGLEGVYWYDQATGNASSLEVLGQPGSFDVYRLLIEGPAKRAAADNEWFKMYADVASLGDIEAICAPCGPPPSTPTATASDTPTATATLTPTATSTGTLPPTVTPTATSTITPSATRTSTPLPKPVYLPLLLREACDPERAVADVVLLLDISSSMTGAKFAAVKEAAKAFVGAMHFPADRVAVVTFAAEGRVLAGLTSDETALLLAVDSMALESGTRIDQGLLKAQELLAGRRQAATPMLVLMTDGLQAAEALERPQELATELRDAGVLLHAVGLGTDVDAAYLLRLAGGDPARLHLSPQVEELVGVYLRIARLIPCPALAFWSGR